MLLLMQAAIVICSVLALIWGWSDGRAGRNSGLGKVAWSLLAMLLPIAISAVTADGFETINTVIFYAVYLAAALVLYGAGRLAGRLRRRA